MVMGSSCLLSCGKSSKSTSSESTTSDSTLMTEPSLDPGEINITEANLPLAKDWQYDVSFPDWQDRSSYAANNRLGFTSYQGQGEVYITPQIGSGKFSLYVNDQKIDRPANSVNFGLNLAATAEVGINFDRWMKSAARIRNCCCPKTTRCGRRTAGFTPFRSAATGKASISIRTCSNNTALRFRRTGIPCWKLCASSGRTESSPSRFPSRTFRIIWRKWLCLPAPEKRNSRQGPGPWTRFRNPGRRRCG